MLNATISLCVLPLVVGGAMLFNGLRDDRRLAGRFAALHKPLCDVVVADAPPARKFSAIAAQTLSVVGGWVLRCGLLPIRTRNDIEATLRGVGQSGSASLRQFVGAKILLVLLLPAGAWFATDTFDTGFFVQCGATAVSAILGMLVPDLVVRMLRGAHMKRVRVELPDALDLMVICAQAGLGLGTIIVRVAHELRHSHRAVALELAHTANDLQMMTDTKVPLTNFGDRCGVDSAKRLAATLLQSAQYGTPLTEALRGLAAELRTELITLFEARAARMPVLLTMPMIAFILPTLFLVIGGPAIIQVIHATN
jgi:tight adherence protein C